MKSYIINSEKEIGAFCDQLLSDLEHKCVLLIGDLGAGKTTITKALIKKLGSKDIGSSPSFSLINEYEGHTSPIYHIDLYRLESAEEAFAIGIEDYIYSGHYCFIEWPQIIAEYIEEPFHTLKIEISDDNSRVITLQ